MVNRVYYTCILFTFFIIFHLSLSPKLPSLQLIILLGVYVHNNPIRSVAASTYIHLSKYFSPPFRVLYD